MEAAYRRRLLRLIDAMHSSVLFWVRGSYRQNPPELAQDSPAAILTNTIEDLARRWQKRFDDAAPTLADYFAKDVDDRSSFSLRRILRDGGLNVKLRMILSMRDVLDATISQQVGLIKSIPRRYLEEVQGMVMRSVQTGRDLATLTDDIEDRYKLTRKRAALIARDQNNKATSAMVHARQESLGIEEAIWMHSHAGKEPRPTHVKMNGRRYKIAEGMWDPAEQRYIQPGELVNCRCTSRPVIPGLGQ